MHFLCIVEVTFMSRMCPCFVTYKMWSQKVSELSRDHCVGVALWDSQQLWRVPRD